MGYFQTLLDEELRRNNGGRKESSEWVAFYGKNDLDRKLNKMIDKIKTIVGDSPFEQVFVHFRHCPTCVESLPKFRTLNTGLTQRLENYTGFDVELDENLKVSGQRTNINGRDIYKFFENATKGVPFVIQNAKIERDADGYHFIPLSDYFVVYVGKLDPFRFLATSFNIANEWLSSV